MNSPHHPHHEHHDVHQQRLLWFFSFCNQRSSSSSNSSSAGSTHSHGAASRTRTNRRKTAANRNKFALQYQQQLQQQQRQSSNVFGLDLTEHTRRFSEEDCVPHIVKSCTRFIEKHGIIFGIYRLSGMRVNIHKLRQDFDKNPKISMIDTEAISTDAHAVACVLKQYFRELPTPLLTFHMYEKFIQLFKQNSINDQHSNNNKNNTTKRQDNDPQPNESLTQTNPSSCAKTADRRDQQPASEKTKCNELDDDDTDVIVDHDNIDDDDDLDINCGDSATTLRIKSKAQTTTMSQPPASNPETLAKATSTSVDETETKKSTIITTTTTTSTSTHQPLKSKLSIDAKPTHLQQQQQQLASGTVKENAPHQTAPARVIKQPFTTSASDSQLISLSSVVTTTASDITYQVKLDDLRKLLLQLPHAHYQTLKFLMRHLACIATNGQKTGMDSKNVAIVWAPNLLKPRELELSAGLETLQVIGLQAVITEQLIKHHEFLFDEDAHEAVGGRRRDLSGVCDINRSELTRD